MITGDNLLTALNVAYNSEIISSKKNVWIGELDEFDKIRWEYVESQDMRD